MIKTIKCVSSGFLPPFNGSRYEAEAFFIILLARDARTRYASASNVAYATTMKGEDLATCRGSLSLLLCESSSGVMGTAEWTCNPVRPLSLRLLIEVIQTVSQLQANDCNQRLATLDVSSGRFYRESAALRCSTVYLSRGRLKISTASFVFPYT